MKWHLNTARIEMGRDEEAEASQPSSRVSCQGDTKVLTQKQSGTVCPWAQTRQQQLAGWGAAVWNAHSLHSGIRNQHFCSLIPRSLTGQSTSAMEICSSSVASWKWSQLLPTVLHESFCVARVELSPCGGVIQSSFLLLHTNAFFVCHGPPSRRRTGKSVV